MTQSLVVGLIVVAAVLYVLWRYMPQKWRNPLGKINPKLAQVLGCGSGCSSCDSAPGAAKSCGSTGGEFSDSKPVTLHGNLQKHMRDQH